MANDLKRGIRVYLETSDYGKGITDMVAATKKYEASLEQLTAESKKMTAEGKNSGKAWDDLQLKLKRTAEQVKRSQAAEADYQAKLKQTEKVLNNLSGSSYNELIDVQKKLQKEVKAATRGTEDHKIKLQQLERVTKEVGSAQREMNSNLGSSVKGLNGFANRLSDMPGIMGVVGSSLQGLGTAFKALIANPAMIAFTAIVALGSGIIALVKNSMEFSKGMSQLSAITGATGDDLSFLKQKAKDLGAQYGKSAVEIVEAMKMVGSAKPELLSNMEALSAVTESVLVLSKATGMDLKDSTSSLTTIMNQFGLGAEEASRTINVLAAGSKFGAVEVDYLGESIVKVGTIAKSAGMSLEETVAAMELFGEMGVKAEVAGTGFKGILGKLQADTRNYTKGVFDLNKAIDNNQSISKSNLELQKAFGAEFYGLAGILLQNKDRFIELTTQVTNTQTAFEQMRIANDNLEGDMGKLSGTWDKFLLSIEDGDGIFAQGSRAVIRFFTGLLNDLTLFGKDAGNIIGFVKDSFQILGMQINAIGTTIGESFSMLGTVARKAIEGDFKGISSTFKEFKATVKDAWSPARWQGIIQQQNAMKQLEKTTRDQIKAEKEAKAEAAKKTTTDNGTGGKDGGTGGSSNIKVDSNKAKETALALALLKEQNLLKESLSNNTKTQAEYDAALITLQRDFLSKKQKLYKVGSKEYEDVRAQIADLELKDQAEYDAMILKALEKSHQSKISATNEFEKIEKQKLLDNFTTKVKFESDTLALEETVSERRLEDAKAYAAQVSMFTYATEEEKVTATKTANDAIINAELALATAIKAIAQKKLDDEKDFQAKKKAFRDQFGLDDISSIKGQYQKELEELKKGLEEKLLTEKEYTSKKRELGAKTGAKYAQQAVQYVGAAADAISAYHQMETNSLEAEKQKQLSAAGNNAEARQKIEEDFAQKELDLRKKQSSANMAISIAQAIANGALAIMNIWATTGINPIAAGILTAFMVGTTAMQVGSIVAQNAAIQSTTLDSSGAAGGAAGGASTGARVVSQAADGRWDVMGADDGRTYRNVPYGGVARTGIGSTPTLMFERGDELIVDNPTLRNLRMNAPYVLDAIRKNRVSQRADGNYDALGGSGSSGGAKDNSALLISVVERNSALLEYLITNGVKAFMLLSEFEKQVLLRDKSLAKGSLKG